MIDEVKRMAWIRMAMTNPRATNIAIHKRLRLQLQFVTCTILLVLGLTYWLSLYGVILACVLVVGYASLITRIAIIEAIMAVYSTHRQGLE